jgi:hypothetical protein
MLFNFFLNTNVLVDVVGSTHCSFPALTICLYLFTLIKKAG